MPMDIFFGIVALIWLLLAVQTVYPRVPRLGLPRQTALLVSLAFPVVFLVMINSTYKTLRQGGIRWRDTFYALELLREGNYR